MASVAYRVIAVGDGANHARSGPVVSADTSGMSDTKDDKRAGDTWIRRERGSPRPRRQP